MDNVDAALRFLARQFASVAQDEAQWHEERSNLEQKVRELETRIQTQEEAYKDALLRVKMLEFALRQERGRYLVSPAPVQTFTTSAAVSMRKISTTSSEGVSAEITRPLPGPRQVERMNSASAATTSSSSQSPAASPSARNKSHSTSTVTRSPSTAKYTEVSRPRMNSRVHSSHESPSHGPTEPAKSTKTPPPPMTLAPKSSNQRPLKYKCKLTSHLDGIRKICFHPTEPILVSGSEDCSVKVWNLNNVSPGPPSQSGRAVELDPILTMRNHTDSVLAVSIISAENFSNNQPHRSGAVATAGRDGTISLLHLYSTETEKGEPLTLEEYQGLKAFSVNRAHEDAIWDLHAHPLSNVLFSVGADGIVRTWGVSSELNLKSELRCTVKSHPSASVGHNNRGLLVPTSVHTLLADSKTCAVGYTNACVGQFDFHGEQMIQLIRANDFESDTRECQVNQIISHPTMPVAIAAHQDRRIRFYDVRAGERIATVVAHQDAVSSIAIDSSGLYVATGGHDGSLRIWSMAERSCVFEQAVHRPKFGEAINCVDYHATRNFVATGGADGVIKIFQ